MLAYALAFKPCSEATDIGSILSWGSVFWRDLVRIRRIQDFPESQLSPPQIPHLSDLDLVNPTTARNLHIRSEATNGKEWMCRFRLFSHKPNQKKIVIGSPNSFFYLFSCLFE